ncbi:ABC transporter, ATP-binding protein [Lachnospiraceae bacterium KM106-2]|nr:ABC transporter, ATP-binding protein [Lachnospiraceae bacterium KM106-2]
MANVLEVNGLYKHYKNFDLDHISFSIKEGKITGFIGINGAGKTTTIRTIAGMIKPNSGEITVFGLDYKKHETEIKNRIGFVFDSGYYYDELNLAQMKSIIAPAYSNWNERTFLDYIDKFELPLKQKISSLSKGMLMKFSLALALSHQADLLIMDEPTSGLDPLVRSQLMDNLLDYVKDSNKSVLFSTHITSDLQKVADDIILINKGTILFQKTLEELLVEYEEQSIEEIMLSSIKKGETA